jgi:hypothetical protein
MNARRLLVAHLAIACACFSLFEGCGLAEGGDGPFGAEGRDATTDAPTKPDGARDDAEADAHDDGPGDAPSERAPVDPCRAFIDAGPDVDAGTGDPVAAFQTFGDTQMFGCSGSVTWPKRNDLCNVDAGCRACTAADWLAGFGDASPRHQYWTDEPLRYYGLELNCQATGSLNGSPCPVDQPFRVCMDGDAAPPRISIDESGNRCHFTRCGFTDAGDGGALDAAPAPNLHFGGCSTGLTAGTLCCCP